VAALMQRHWCRCCRQRHCLLVAAAVVVLALPTHLRSSGCCANCGGWVLLVVPLHNPGADDVDADETALLLRTTAVGVGGCWLWQRMMPDVDAIRAAKAALLPLQPLLRALRWSC
jgi:hypothetical protein